MSRVTGPLLCFKDLLQVLAMTQFILSPLPSNLPYYIVIIGIFESLELSGFLSLILSNS